MKSTVYNSLLPYEWVVDFIGDMVEEKPCEFFVRAKSANGKIEVAYGTLENCFRTIRANIELDMKKPEGAA